MEEGISTELKASSVNIQPHQYLATSSNDKISVYGGRSDMNVKISSIQEKIQSVLANSKSFKEQFNLSDETSTENLNQTVLSRQTSSLTVRV